MTIHQDDIERARAMIHKAVPIPDEAVPIPAGVELSGTHCAICGQRVKRVPGGQGMTWVHSDTGMVAAPNPPQFQTDWWEDHRKLFLTAQYIIAQGGSIDEVLYLIEKPWKHTDEYRQAEAEPHKMEGQ